MAQPGKLSAGTVPCLPATQRPWPACNGRAQRQQHAGAVGARRRAVQCAAAARPFGGAPSSGDAAGGRQQPAAALATQAWTATASQPAVAVVQAPPPVEVQLRQLSGLMAELGRTATYRDKMEVVMSQPAARTFFRRTREGRLVARELAELAPKEAYCLACLPALCQQHVLALIPTGVPVTPALAKLAAALARVEDFYDSIGGLVGYQAQCLALLAQQQGEGAPPGSPTSSSSSSYSSDGSMCSADDAWPTSTLANSGTASGGTSGGASLATDFLVPVGLDLASPSQAAQAASAVAAGLDALPHMAEVYPLGGAGDRLGLRCDSTGESLPTAVLRYCGRSLLENLLRDLQAREYLYWKLHGRQHTTPVAIMTSAAKGNHWRVEQLFEEAAWFGRGASSFRLFQQPLVPMVAAHDGRWLMQHPLQLMMKPGGHGVIWKLMIDTGVFDWLAAQGRQAAIVRQISNPMAGTDNTLLALAGAGFPGRRSFGFASCERAVGAAEGMNVLAQERLPAAHPDPSAFHHHHGQQQQQQQQHTNGNVNGGLNGNHTNGSINGSVNGRHVNGSLNGSLNGHHANGSVNGAANGTASPQPQYRYRVTNVEYTEFERLGVADASVDDASPYSVFPANTNVLYVGLPAVERTVRASMAAGSTDAVLPGMILNTSKRVSWTDPLAGGAERSTAAGRLECTMQNLADCLAQSFPAPLESCEEHAGLDTFLVYNQRRKVTSSAKRKLKAGSTQVHQTPDGSFLDLQRNAQELLSTHCGWEVPEVGSVSEYLSHGPAFVFLAHPALGPLWSVIAQKLRGGSLAPHSELQLEVAEACLQDVHVAGSLLVSADAALGHTDQRAVPDGAPAARQSSLLEALLSPGTNSSLNGLNGVEGSGSRGGAEVEGDEQALGGYSQPCSPTAPPCQPGALESRLVFSQQCGRLRLHNVRVQNAGVEWAHPDNVWWRHSLARTEACRIHLHGTSEFEARDVTLPGDLRFDVPHGHRMLVTAGPAGELVTRLERLAGPTWQWQYSMSPEGQVLLELQEGEGGSQEGTPCLPACLKEGSPSQAPAGRSCQRPQHHPWMAGADVA